MAAVAAASDQRLASVTALRCRRGQRRIQSLPESRSCARIARNMATSPMSAAAAAASAAPLAPSTSTSAADEDDNTGGGSDDDASVLFFAYGALMDPTVMRSRLQGRKAGSSPTRAAVAVAFAEKGGRKEGKSSSSSSVAVAFVHRGGWATLVDLPRARASAASPLWRLVPGSRGEEEQGRGGGWGQAEGGRSDDDERARDESGPSFSASSGPCFCSPAHGVLYALSSESDLEALAEKEGGYSLRKVEVRVSCSGSGGGGGGSGGGGSGGGDGVAAPEDDSKRAPLLLEAFAFVSSPGLRLRSPLPPRERYLEKMRSGARAAGLDEGYRAWLERVPSAAEDLDGRYQATPAGAVAAAAGVAVFAAVMCLLV